MCGISGIYNFLNKDLDGKKIIKKIIRIQNTRGPDNSNLWGSECNKVYFGHNRLSIIDLSNILCLSKSSILSFFVLFFFKSFLAKLHD